MVSSCCDPAGYQATFGERFARRMARRYRKRGLDRTQQRMLGFLTERGIDGATILEIGGGVGEFQVELLRRGAVSATNLEISTHYEDEARRLLDVSRSSASTAGRSRSGCRSTTPSGPSTPPKR